MKSIPGFENKVVLVTGGASGIGRGIVELFAANGAQVYAADINENSLQQLKSAKGSISALRLDVSRDQDFQQAIEHIVTERGRLDILVNNAGIALAGDFNDTDMAAIERIVAINFWSVIYGTKFAYAQMVKQGHGHIVNVSSSGGAMPVPNQTMYSGIKHAVLGFSHSLREEAEQYGVKISTVLPGMVSSDLWDTAVNVKDYNMKKTMQETGLKPISAHQAAEAILQGIQSNDRSIIFPWVNKVILALYRWMPGLLTKVAVKPLANSSGDS